MTVLAPWSMSAEYAEVTVLPRVRVIVTELSPLTGMIVRDLA